MNTDIRIKCNFPQHIKTRKLIKKLGYEGFYSLVSLWCYAAQSKPKGILNMSIEDIAFAANWQGDAEMFVTALLQCGFLEKIDGGVLALHDWEQHNRYVYYAEERTKVARELADKRWHKKRYGLNKPSDANGIANRMQKALPSVCEGQCQPYAPSPSPFPSPSPDPDPKNIYIYSCDDFCDKKSEKNDDICTQSDKSDFVPAKATLKVSFNESEERFIISPDLLQKYKEAYPDIQVETEIKKMEVWVLSRPKSKWKKDWRRFITGWLSREQKKAEFNLARNEKTKGRSMSDYYKRILQDNT